MSAQDPAELARRFLAALSAGDQTAVGELVHPEVEIRTERTIHRGRLAAMKWSGKVFDHLFRRYVPIEIEETTSGVLVHAELQYVWRDSGKVGDTLPRRDRARGPRRTDLLLVSSSTSRSRPNPVLDLGEARACTPTASNVDPTQLAWGSISGSPSGSSVDHHLCDTGYQAGAENGRLEPP